MSDIKGSRVPVAIVSAVVFAMAAAKLGASLVLGNTRVAHDLDFRYFYVAGLTWRQGLNPYDFYEYSRVSPFSLQANFAYAPTAAPLFISLSWLPIGAAKVVFRGTNLAAALAVAVMLALIARRTLADRVSGFFTRSLPAMIGALVLVSPSVSINLLLGQTSLIVVALLCGCYLCHEAGHRVASGVLAAVATFKPSLSIFVLLLLFLARDRVTLAVTIIVSFLLAAWPLSLEGPIDLARDWIAATRDYTKLEQNLPGSPENYGLGSILADFGLSALIPTPLALAGFAWSVWRRERLGSLGLFAFSLAWPVLLITSHHYDGVALFPLFTFTLLLSNRRSPEALALTLLLVISSLVPGSLLDAFAARGIPVPSRFKQIIDVTFLVWSIVMVERDGRTEGRGPPRE
jgi:hypothetical protein